jgi:hypothetical protein
MRRLLVIVLILGAATSGCTKVAQDKDKLLAAIDSTEQLARTFSYTENASGHQTVVTGDGCGDRRYQVAASVDGRPLLSEVVYDDTRAVKIEDSTAGKILVAAPNSAASAAAPAVSATKGVALQTGVWLEDQKAARSLLLGSPSRSPGKDPLTDALTALEYVRFAISQAQGVFKFNPESESYRPKLDPFPRPAAGVTRYDLLPPDLPARQRVGTGANIGVLNQVPGVPFFRLLAVYVRDGIVVDVREQIAVTPRLVDSQSNLEARLNDFTSAAKPTQPLNYQAAALLFSINQKLAREGQPLIRPRTLDLEFSSLGKAPAVSLPAGATQTDLSGLGAYDLLLYETH